MKKFLIAILFLTFTMMGLSVNAEEGKKKDSAAEEKYPVAIAKISGTAEGSEVSGKVRYFKTDKGLKAKIYVSGVSTGKHGIHIHENGSCDDGGKAAGGHFNPHGVDHGYLPKNGLEGAHLGDMGNVEVDEDGEGVAKVDLPGLTLDGVHAIMGKAVILHEKEDDFGQPTGNAGGRIGCGIITSVKDYKGSREDHGSMKGSDVKKEAIKGSDDAMKGSEKGSKKGSY